MIFTSPPRCHRSVAARYLLPRRDAYRLARTRYFLLCRTLLLDMSPNFQSYPCLSVDIKQNRCVVVLSALRASSNTALAKIICIHHEFCLC